MFFATSREGTQRFGFLRLENEWQAVDEKESPAHLMRSLSKSFRHPVIRSQKSKPNQEQEKGVSVSDVTNRGGEEKNFRKQKRSVGLASKVGRFSCFGLFLGVTKKSSNF